MKAFKGSLDQIHFNFEVNVGKSRIRHRTILNFEWHNLKSILKIHFIQIRSRSMSDPTFSDIDFKNKMAWVWTILKVKLFSNGFKPVLFLNIQQIF